MKIILVDCSSTLEKLHLLNFYLFIYLKKLFFFIADFLKHEFPLKTFSIKFGIPLKTFKNIKK